MSVGLEFEVDVDFTFFLNKDEIGIVHREQASNYERVIMSRAEEALKNSAAKQVGFSDFFQERKRVEAVFRAAIEERWNSPPSLHCKMDQFHLGRVRDSVWHCALSIHVQFLDSDSRVHLSGPHSRFGRRETAPITGKIEQDSHFFVVLF